MFKADNLKGGERESIDKCLRQLQVDCVDLMLVHCPCTSTGEYNAAYMPHMFELSEGKATQVRPLCRSWEVQCGALLALTPARWRS